MTMVCGLDLHRRQITFDAVQVESGQVWSGRVWQPDWERFRRWLRDDVTERAAQLRCSFVPCVVLLTERWRG
jgi:hypothetical protein